MKNRRDLFKNSITLLASLGLGSKAIASNRCTITPDQTEGPFYPIRSIDDKKNDLTYVVRNGKKFFAKGEKVIIKGRILDQNCRPIKGALVEIWQACVTGKYNHPSDPNNAKLDPNFQYSGRFVTNSKGRFIFKTIRPGQYPADRNWIRPAHVHFKVHLRGHEELTTQMYFADDNLNKKDLILKRLGNDQRKNVVVEFLDRGRSIKEGIFNITLNKIQ